MEKIRLNKYIAEQGICSRRQADELIFAGKIKINGKIVKELGTKIDPVVDKVIIDNNKIVNFYNILKNKKFINKQIEKIYIALNKPVDYISSTTSKQGKSIMELIPKKFGRLYPVGRLDKNSEGLIILTNDGELTNILTHPKFKHEKEYLIEICPILANNSDSLSDQQIILLKKGLKISGELMKIKEIKKNTEKEYKLILTEGKKRQIRLMMKNLGFMVSKLKRIRINKLKLGSLPVGKWIKIKRNQII